MDKKLLEQVIKRDLPGYKISDRSLHNENIEKRLKTVNQIEANTPDFRLLQQKYLHSGNLFNLNSKTDLNDVSKALFSDQDEIITVYKTASEYIKEKANFSKVVVISGSGKKIIGEQG